MILKLLASFFLKLDKTVSTKEAGSCAKDAFQKRTLKVVRDLPGYFLNLDILRAKNPEGCNPPSV